MTVPSRSMFISYSWLISTTPRSSYGDANLCTTVTVEDGERVTTHCNLCLMGVYFSIAMAKQWYDVWQDWYSARCFARVVQVVDATVKAVWRERDESTGAYRSNKATWLCYPPSAHTSIRAMCPLRTRMLVLTLPRQCNLPYRALHICETEAHNIWSHFPSERVATLGRCCMQWWNNRQKRMYVEWTSECAL